MAQSLRDRLREKRGGNKNRFAIPTPAKFGFVDWWNALPSDAQTEIAWQVQSADTFVADDTYVVYHDAYVDADVDDEENFAWAARYHA